jgi:hypothetical protein
VFSKDVKVPLQEVELVVTTTEPIRHRIGSVVELTFNKSVILRVRAVGLAFFCLIIALSLSPITPPPFTLLATLTFLKRWEVLRHIVFPKWDPNVWQELNPVPLFCLTLALPLRQYNLVPLLPTFILSCLLASRMNIEDFVDAKCRCNLVNSESIAGSSLQSIPNWNNLRNIIRL